MPAGRVDRSYHRGRRLGGSSARLMKLQQVGDNCFAVLHERNRLCDANSG